MLIVGRYGMLVGTGGEIAQQIVGLPSGMNAQDFYSNNLGYRFYNIYDSSGPFLLRLLTGQENFTTYLESFLLREKFIK